MRRKSGWMAAALGAGLASGAGAAASSHDPDGGRGQGMMGQGMMGSGMGPCPGYDPRWRRHGMGAAVQHLEVDRHSGFVTGMERPRCHR